MESKTEAPDIDSLLSEYIRTGSPESIDNMVTLSDKWIMARLRLTIEKLSHCDADTDDMTQIFRSEMLHILRFEREKILKATHPKSYIAKACINEVLTKFFGRAYMKREKIFDHDDVVDMLECKQNTKGLQSKPYDLETILNVMKGVQGISPHLQEMLGMKFLNPEAPLKDSEISKRLGLSVGTIEMIFVRFRKKLRTALANRGIRIPDRKKPVLR